MFVLSCRKERAAIDVPGLVGRTWVSGAMHVVLARDARTSRLEDQAHGFRFLDPAPGADGAGTNAPVALRHDAREERLVISAGPSADTAVYYHLDGTGGFTCASHVHLLRAAGVPIEENTRLLPEYFRYRYVTPPHTLYKDVWQLAKADLEVSLSGDRCVPLRPRRYRIFPEPAHGPCDPDELVQGTLEIFETSLQGLEAVRDRVVVPLSGGMDSSVLFRLGQRRFGLGDAYSAGYPFEAERDNRERRYAASAARAFGARHHYYAGTTERYLEAVIRAIAAAEEPIHHLQSAMIDLLFRDHVPPEKDVVVLGVGASGVFGTPLHGLIRSHRRHPALYDALAVAPIRRLLENASRRTGRGRRLVKTVRLSRRLELPTSDPANVIWSVDSYGDPEWICERFGCSEAALVQSRAELVRPYADLGLLEGIAVIDLFDKTQFLWGKILRSLGRRTHYPFMQQDLQQHVLAAPWPLRLKATKHVLAEVARRLGIPEFIVRRAKSGFGVRRGDWALPGGPLQPLVPLAASVVDEAELRSLQSRQPERAMGFWCLLNYALWRRICIDQEPAEALVSELREGRRT